MDKAYQNALELAMAHCIAYANQADRCYGGAAEAVAAFRQVFGALRRHGIIGDYGYAPHYDVRLPPGYPGCFASDETGDPNGLIADALERALSELCDWHFERLESGRPEDPWFLHQQRQAVRDVLSVFESRGLITYNIDVANRQERGVRAVRTPDQPGTSRRPSMRA